MRIMGVWCPDWPVAAATAAGLVEPGSAAALTGRGVAAGRVAALSAVARRHGVRRGMTLRQAAAVCPEVTIVEADPGREEREFAPVVDRIADIAATVEIIRPGLVLVDSGAVAKYRKISEDDAAQLILDAAADTGVECVCGIASSPATAMIAARKGVIVPPGGDTDFLAPLPLRMLLAEAALGCDEDVVDTLSQVGVATLGDLAALPPSAIMARFSKAGIRCHRIAAGDTARQLAPAEPGGELSVTLVPPEPMKRVDEAAFAARDLARQLHARLAEAGLFCHRLAVTATVRTKDGQEQELTRIWHTTESLSEKATADRVRWQLDGWLTRLKEGQAAGLVSMTVDPVECSAPSAEATGLWDSFDAGKETAHRVISRVQSLLGPDKVVVPHEQGGRFPTERIRLVPFGETPRVGQTKNTAWPGALPGPYPALMGAGPGHPAAEVTLIDAHGGTVGVTAEALVTAPPVAVQWGRLRYTVTGWAGPWPVDDGWWTNKPARAARLEVTATQDTTGKTAAWIMVWVGQKWRVEATF